MVRVGGSSEYLLSQPVETQSYRLTVRVSKMLMRLRKPYVRMGSSA